MLYAAPIWAGEVTRDRGRRTRLEKVQRLVSLRVVRAYRTVSYDAATLLARLPPVDVVAMRNMETYLRIAAMKSQHLVVTTEVRMELKNVASRGIMRHWKRRLQSENRSGGAVIRSAIIPVMSLWLSRSHGSMTFELTQVLTGHGVFRHYLWRMSRRESATCRYCSARFEDNIHCLIACPQWNDTRDVFRRKLGVSLTIKNILMEITDSEVKWNAFADFCAVIVGKMNADERDEEMRGLGDR